jgi:predicted glutamine amidotransferase
VAANLPVFALNFVLASADGLWILRYPETHPLYLLERAPGRPLEHSSELGSRVRCEQAANRRVAVVATERMDADAGWRMLRAGELVHVTDTVEIRSREILGAPPVRQLTLEDLAPRARASQSGLAAPSPLDPGAPRT